MAKKADKDQVGQNGPNQAIRTKDERPKVGTFYKLRVRRVSEMVVEVEAKTRNTDDLIADFEKYEKSNKNKWTEEHFEYTAIKEVKA